MDKLQNKIIITTQPKDQAGRLSGILAEKGAVVYSFPMIETIPADPDENIIKILNEIENYNWLIFTSKKGVSAFLQILKKLNKTAEILNSLKIAVIGKSTAKELEKKGIRPDFINPGNTSADFIKYLQSPVIKKSDKVLLALGNLASASMENSLQYIAGVTRINVYNTIQPKTYDEQILSKIIEDNYDLLIFTSPSAFTNFLKITGLVPGNLSLRIATIGRTTTRAIEKKGFNVLITAGESSLEGLANEIMHFYEIKV